MIIVPPAVLVAAGLDWLEGLLPLLFVAVWVISQVVGLIRRIAGADGPPKREPAPRPPRVGPPAVRPPVAPAGRGDARVELERQIEDFLALRRDGRPTPRPAAAGRPPATATASKPRPAAERKAAKAAPRGAAQTSVARHVQDAFAHELGHLPASLPGHERPPAAAPGGAAVGGGPAIDIVALLRDPVTVRQMVILKEVLERPVDRW